MLNVVDTLTWWDIMLDVVDTPYGGGGGITLTW